MNTVNERIEALRQLMRAQNIVAYIVPTSDPHNSEMVGEYFKCREFITGFTGSAGTAVITMDEALLWTDGRYFLQAAEELKGSCVQLMKMQEPGVPTIFEWLSCNISDDGKLAFDGQVMPLEAGRRIMDAVGDETESNVQFNLDLVREIWTDRPAMSTEPAWLLDEKYAGESTANKLSRIRSVMSAINADAHILTTLDDIDWILNIRGNDVPYAPLVLSYLIIYMDRAVYYVDENKLDTAILEHLARSGVIIRPYVKIFEDVRNLTNVQSVLVDPDNINFELYYSIPSGISILEAASPSILMKSIKNKVELNNIRNAHIKDGVAVTKLMYWLKKNYGKIEISELDVCEKFNELRKKQDGYIQDSFEPICASNEHAAIIHYSSTPETNVKLTDGLLLTDTGGAYYDGSTDISRTFILGSVNNEIKHDFTLVMKSHINLAKAHFLHGCYGFNLDILARQVLWEEGLDYKHGTGHGVGYLGNIHEGPCNFRWRIGSDSNEHILENGMVITIEPGIYKEDKYGIRLENEIIVRKGELNECGQFMYLEPITMAPFDLDGVNPSEMRSDEIEWLNAYHQEVYNKISPYLTEEEANWLREYTRKI